MALGGASLAPVLPSVGIGASPTTGSTVAASDAQNTADNQALLGSIIQALSPSTTPVTAPWYDNMWVWIAVIILALVWWLK